MCSCVFTLYFVHVICNNAYIKSPTRTMCMHLMATVCESDRIGLWSVAEINLNHSNNTTKIQLVGFQKKKIIPSKLMEVWIVNVGISIIFVAAFWILKWIACANFLHITFNHGNENVLSSHNYESKSAQER